MQKSAIDARSVIITVEGKLIGSAARRLWENLEALHADGIDRIILDMRACRSVDSLGVYGIGRALHSGQEILLVTTSRFRVEDFVTRDVLTHSRLSRFNNLDAARRFLESKPLALAS